MAGELLTFLSSSEILRHSRSAHPIRRAVRLVESVASMRVGCSVLAWVLVVGCAGAPRAEVVALAPAASRAGERADVVVPLSAEALARARAEGRPVVLTIRAGWCHWCHVMEETTYRDPQVVALLRERFVAVWAEADAQPDLATRYAAYGWPATVILTPDGQEIVALRGYRAPRALASILRAIAADQDSGRALGGSIAPAERAPRAVRAGLQSDDLDAVRDAVVAQLDAAYDARDAGWGTQQRYPLAAPVEHALFRAAVRGERAWRERALESLERYARLIDPVWGGMYQYSESGVWDRPHYEKIASVQAGAIEAFASAYAVTGEARWLAHARAVARFVRERLRAEDGAFFPSQDADPPDVAAADFYARDDAGRRRAREPRIDPHVYASTNGRLIAALARLSEVAPVEEEEEGALELARTAAERIGATHLDRERGLFCHEACEVGSETRYLADQSEMLRAYVALHRASGDARWLAPARALAAATVAAMRAEGGGLYASTGDPALAGALAERTIPVEHGATFARALLALARLEDREEYREEALAALRAVARTGALPALGRMVGEYALALELAASGAILVHVVGPAGDPRTDALHRAALAWSDPRRLVERRAAGEARFGFPGEPAAFLCSESACSMPITDPRALAREADAFVAAE